MHYIRCLRAPKVTLSGKTPLLELTLTVTTDLGDSFMSPPSEPIPLVVTVHVGDEAAAAKRAWPLAGKHQLLWKAGQRVAKPTLRLPPEAAGALAAGRAVELCVSAASRYAVHGVEEVLVSDGGEGGDGLVMPVWTILGSRAGEDVDASFRKLGLSDVTPGGLPAALTLSEEIGESIARHIWDGGLVATCALYGTFAFPNLEASRGSCVRAVKSILSSSGPLNVLEVGCGVGVLGLGIASLRAALHKDAGGSADDGCLLLMTDLEAAEQRALSNMAQLSALPGQRVLYENLDWEDGRRGRFGPTAASRRWGLVVLSDCTYNVDMLPALVETLSALHAHNCAADAAAAADGSGEAGAGSGSGSTTVTRVFLATKPRHASERALFDLMAEHGWVKSEEQVVPLPVIGSDPESVELYLFEKR